SYLLTALAYDNSGAAVRSSGIAVTVSGGSATPSPTPSIVKMRVTTTTPLITAGNTARFKIIASEMNPTQNTMVSYSLSGTAAAGLNYSTSGMGGTAMIPAGQRAVVLPMQTLNSGANSKVVLTIQPSSGYDLSRGTTAVV